MLFTFVPICDTNLFISMKDLRLFQFLKIERSFIVIFRISSENEKIPHLRSTSSDRRWSATSAGGNLGPGPLAFMSRNA